MYPTITSYEEWCKFFEASDENKEILFKMHKIGTKRIVGERIRDKRRYEKKKEQKEKQSPTNSNPPV
jgi:hypothetical protein